MHHIIPGLLFPRFRFETLEPEMNALAARVTAVNDIAEQLLKASPPGKDRIIGTQEQLNQRWEAAPGHLLTRQCRWHLEKEYGRA